MTEIDPMKIESIDELIVALNTCGVDQPENCFLNVMRSESIAHVEWEKYFKFNDDRPVIVCLSKTDDYEIFLSCWEKGQAGPIHDIDSENAWIHPICGRFIEERYRLTDHKLEQVSSVLLNSESYSYMPEFKTIYRYVNVYEARSVCLHLYARPVTEWREYDKETGQTKIVKHEYDVILFEGKA